MRVARLEAKASQWTEVILAIGTAIVVLAGTHGVLADPPVRTPGDLLLFYFYLRTLNRPVRGFARLVTRAAKAAASAALVWQWSAHRSSDSPPSKRREAPSWPAYESTNVLEA